MYWRPHRDGRTLHQVNTTLARASDQRTLQRRVISVLVAGQVLGGIGMGATLAIGAVIAAELAGDAWSGAAATMSTLGAAAASIPLARLANRHGRRTALSVGMSAAAAGALVTVAATGMGNFVLLLLGYAALGSGAAVNLQSRFAATDLAQPGHRGRDLSIVVWSTTIGAVAGPNLFGPGEDIAQFLGMPQLTGSFALAVAAQVAAVVVYQVGLRPDPFLASRSTREGSMSADAVPAPVRAVEPPSSTVDESAPDPRQNAARKSQDDASSAERTQMWRQATGGNGGMVVFAIGAIAISHAVMVSVMAMTPVHLAHHGASLTIIGFTISLHVAGMFGLSPVFGWLSDRVGRLPVILLGQLLLAIALVTVALGAGDATLVTVGLVFLGLGWSAATVAGSVLVTDLVTDAARTRVQGRTDLVMNITGAVGGAAAGPVLALVTYPGLALVTGGLVLVVVGAAVGFGIKARPVRGAASSA